MLAFHEGGFWLQAVVIVTMNQIIGWSVTSWFISCVDNWLINTFSKPRRQRSEEFLISLIENKIIWTVGQRHKEDIKDRGSASLHAAQN